jgi:hypothetical protein
MEFRNKARGWIVKTSNEITIEQYIKRPDLWEQIVNKKGKKKK